MRINEKNEPCELQKDTLDKIKSMAEKIKKVGRIEKKVARLPFDLIYKGTEKGNHIYNRHLNGITYTIMISPEDENIHQAALADAIERDKDLFYKSNRIKQRMAFERQLKINAKNNNRILTIDEAVKEIE